MQKHLSDPLDCLIEWCENNSEIKDKYPLIINNAKDELKKLRKKAESSCEKKDKGQKIDEFFKLFPGGRVWTEERIEQKQAELKRIPFPEFKIMVDEYLAKHNLRQGQAIMNVLGDTYPEIYREITGTELDCFYDDEKLNKLLEYLEEKLQSK
jgi:hypothetical protein